MRSFQAARAYVYETARKLDLNKGGNRLDSDGVKLFAATVGKNIADRAIQVLGGYGYVGEYHGGEALERCKASRNRWWNH